MHRAMSDIGSSTPKDNKNELKKKNIPSTITIYDVLYCQEVLLHHFHSNSSLELATIKLNQYQKSGSRTM